MREKTPEEILKEMMSDSKPIVRNHADKVQVLDSERKGKPCPDCGYYAHYDEETRWLLCTKCGHASRVSCVPKASDQGRKSLESDCSELPKVGKG